MVGWRRRDWSAPRRARGYALFVCVSVAVFSHILGAVSHGHADPLRNQDRRDRANEPDTTKQGIEQDNTHEFTDGEFVYKQDRSIYAQCQQTALVDIAAAPSMPNLSPSTSIDDRASPSRKWSKCPVRSCVVTLPDYPQRRGRDAVPSIDAKNFSFFQHSHVLHYFL